MASINRAVVIAKLHKVLKRHYQPIELAHNRTLLENLLYAACLENTPYDSAAEGYQAISTAFFDWNEVRVSSVKELSEVMRGLPDAQGSANQLRRTLQAVFEANYSFDIEAMKKLNLGAAVQKLSGYDGITPFAVSLATQYSLGGHSIPLDTGAMMVLYAVGLVAEDAAPKDGCAGLERAIPKNKGLEFGSLLHQLAADFHASPFSTNVHKILLEVDPEAKSRFPKRHPKVEKKPEPAPTPAPPAPVAAGKGKPEVKSEGKAKPDDKKQAEEKKAVDDKKAGAAGKKSAAAATPTAKKPAAATPPKKPAAASSSPTKKPAAKAAAKAPPTIAKRKPR